ADSIVTACATGSSRSVAMSGVWVGLAFQAKMIEAWFVLPALGVTYLVVSNRGIWTRILQLAGMAAIVVAVSLSWMVFVSLTPNTQRPYVDGSQNNSIIQQVFDYNGFGRVGQPSPNELLGRTLDSSFLERPAPAASWDRLFSGFYGRDTGWLLPVSLLVIALGLVALRRRKRADMLRAGIVLWGAWLIVFLIAFSVIGINSYYLGALSPPIAALVGIGCELALQNRDSLIPRFCVLGAVVVSTAYAYWLLPASGTGLPTWLQSVLLALGASAALLLVTTLMYRVRRHLIAPLLVVSGLAIGIVPLVASVSVVTNDLGAFDTPFQSEQTTSFLKAFFSAPLDISSELPKLESVRDGAPDLMATQTSVLAASFIFLTGQEVLPIGGYTGTIPAPTVASLERMVAAGQFHLVIAGPYTTDPRIAWIAGHCIKLRTAVKNPGSPGVLPLRLYYCLARA
ncbi:MAG: hypothetical protein WAM97_03100, partial [Acidimicrobiales bacterium]